MDLKDWELDRNMYDNGEDVSAIFQQDGQNEKDIDRIKSDYDNWLRDIQDNTRPRLSPLPGGNEEPKAVSFHRMERGHDQNEKAGHLPSIKYSTASTECAKPHLGSYLYGNPYNWYGVRNRCGW